MADSIRFRIDGLPNAEAIERRSRELCDQVGAAHELITGLGWTKARDHAANALRAELARQDGLSWLAHAWTVSQELKAAAAETLEGVPERRVSLLSHSLSQQVLPTVELRCGALHIDFPFCLDLSADIECVELVVRHGCLVRLQSGRLTPSAALSLGKVEICRKACDPIDLIAPFEMAGEGLRIPTGTAVGAGQT